MADFTDKELARVEKELQSLYSAVYKDLKKELQAISDKWEFEADMTPQERYLTAQKYNRLNALTEQMRDSLANANREAMAIVNKSNVNVYQQNYNQTLEKFQEYAPNLNFPVIDKAGVAKILRGEVNPFKKMAMDGIKDKAALQRDLTRSLTSGIMQGKSIPNLAKDIRGLVNRDLFQATRIARTEVTKVQNSARQDAFDKGKDMGLHIVKRWVATKDPRTREEHLSAHGQTVPNSEPFIVGGEKLMHPGADGASAANVINCRCTIVSEVVTKEEYQQIEADYKKL